MSNNLEFLIHSTQENQYDGKQQELKQAVLQFVQDEFAQSAEFTPVAQDAISSDNTLYHNAIHKDGGLMEGIWLTLQIIATVEGVLQFSERAKRLQRVKKLLAVIEKVGQPVYLRIKDQSINLYGKTADQIMNLLAGDKPDNE